MRKSLAIQFALVSAFLVCAFVLNIMILSLAVEKGNMDYTYVTFSGMFFLCGLIAVRVLVELRDEYLIDEEESVKGLV